MLKINDLIFNKTTQFYEQAMINGGKSIDYVAQASRYYDSVLKNAQIFLLDKNFHTEEHNDITTIDITLLNFPLPFKTCYIEMNDKEAGLMVGLRDNDDKTSGIAIFSLLAHEKAPGLVEGWIFGLDQKNSLPVVGSFSTAEYSTLLDRLAITALHKVCSYVHNCNLGIESIYRTVEHKSLVRQRSSQKIEHIIRVKPAKSIKFPEAAFSRSIDWDMRWWVRGHWRRLPAAEILGKDRDGVYSVRGFTWVNEHLKGPDETPIRRAIYTLGAIQCQA